MKMNIKKSAVFLFVFISSIVQAQPFGSGGVQYIKPTGYLNESVGSRYYEIKCNVGEITHVLHKPKSNSGEVINQWLTGDQRQVLSFYAGATTEGFAQAACGIVSNAQSRVPSETAQRSPKAILDEGFRLIKEKNFTQAERVLSAPVVSSDPYGLYLLGYIYESASPPLQNFTTALEYYKKSADKGFAAAMYSVGVAYETGKGVIVDKEYATKFFTEAANKNDGRSLYALGLKYAEGRGVDRNLDVAIEMLRRAVSQNVAGAEQALTWAQNAKLGLQDQEARVLKD